MNLIDFVWKNMRGRAHINRLWDRGVFLKNVGKFLFGVVSIGTFDSR